MTSVFIAIIAFIAGVISAPFIIVAIIWMLGKPERLDERGEHDAYNDAYAHNERGDRG